MNFSISLMKKIETSLIEADINLFRSRLHCWYELYHRLLPWREVKDPYLIWISEVILQQTRVEQALSYYQEFVRQFPTVIHLANADEDSVLKCWQGLGYYSRARNLHASAKIITDKFNGVFPRSYEDVRGLKGVGDYTAAAICSFAYDLPYAVLDGNVYRFLSRYFAIEMPIDTSFGKRMFSDLAERLLDERYSALHNQAMMEMGAIQCVVNSPNCSLCPLKESCLALKYEMVEYFPIKTKKTKVRKRYFYYFFVKYKNGFFLKKRKGADIWKNLYEFPLLEYSELMLAEDVLSQKETSKYLGNDFVLLRISDERKHVLSHQHIYSYCFYIEIKDVNEYLTKYFNYVDFDDIYKYPVSRLIEIFIDEYLDM